jgi:hypothetical protein
LAHVKKSIVSSAVLALRQSREDSSDNTTRTALGSVPHTAAISGLAAVRLARRSFVCATNLSVARARGRT